MSVNLKRKPQYLRLVDTGPWSLFPLQHAWKDEAWKAERIGDDVILGHHSLLFFSQLKDNYLEPITMREGLTIGIERTRYIDKPLEHWSAFLTHQDAVMLFPATVEMSCECSDAAKFLPGIAGKGWHKVSIKFSGGFPQRSGRVWFSAHPQHSASFGLNNVTGADEVARLTCLFERSVKSTISMAIVFPIDTQTVAYSGRKQRLASALPIGRVSSKCLHPGAIVVGNETQRTISTECMLVVYTQKVRDFSGIDYLVSDCGAERSRITTWHSQADKYFILDESTTTETPSRFTLKQLWVNDAGIRWPFTYEQMAQIAMVMLRMRVTPSLAWTVPFEDRAVFSDLLNIDGASITSITLPVYPLMWILDWLPEFTHRTELLKVRCLQRVEASLRKLDEARAAGPASRTRGVSTKRGVGVVSTKKK